MIRLTAPLAPLGSHAITMRMQHMKGSWTVVIVCVALGVASCSSAVTTSRSSQPAYLDQDLSFETRVNDLMGRMTLEEKVSQMKDVAPAIPRLGIPEYNWWNEALHGVARAGLATVFPQAIGFAATWDDSLIFQMATVIWTRPARSTM